MNEAKPFYTSKTMIFNILTLIVMIMESTQFTALVPAGFESYIVTGVALINVWLRSITTSPVSAA